MKIRHCLYLEPKVSKQLDSLAAKPGTSKSQIVNSAVASYIGQRGANQIEASFRLRLDRIGDQINRIERDQKIALESVALFIRYYLTTTAPLPTSQLAASQATGNDRFQTFIDEVSRRIAKGKNFGGDVIERGNRNHEGANGAIPRAVS
jgi:hypothetical protein